MRHARRQLPCRHRRDNSNTACFETRQKTVETSEATREQLEVAAILAAHAPLSAANESQVYVQRDEVEKTLKSFVERINPYGYMVVVGPRGAGKSTLVSHVLKEMGKGVLVVQVKNQSATVPELKDCVLKAALDQYAPHKESEHATTTPVKDRDLAERLKTAANAGRKEDDKEVWLPTLAFEITSSGDGTLIKNVCTILKEVAADLPLCHGLLVLSSSFAVAELTADRARQHFLRVGAFSHDEASAYLDAQFKARVPDEIATVAALTTVKDRILPLTTLPSYIRGLTQELSDSTNEADLVACAETWASQFEAAVRTDVEGASNSVFNIFIRDETGKERCFTTRDLMRKILDTSAPVKLPSATYEVPLHMFASKIRTSDEAKAAFNVDLVSKTVDFASAAHRKAAAELLASSSSSSLLSWRLFGRRM
jgi:DNA polymerase III delta prime subunit